MESAGGPGLAHRWSRRRWPGWTGRGPGNRRKAAPARAGGRYRTWGGMMPCGQPDRSAKREGRLRGLSLDPRLRGDGPYAATMTLDPRLRGDGPYAALRPT